MCRHSHYFLNIQPKYQQPNRILITRKTNEESGSKNELNLIFSEKPIYNETLNKSLPVSVCIIDRLIFPDFLRCRGLIPRICETMFHRMSAGKEEGTSYRTEVSYLEIYNERVKDLLKKNSTHNLKVRKQRSNLRYLLISYRPSLHLLQTVHVAPNENYFKLLDTT